MIAPEKIALLPPAANCAALIVNSCEGLAETEPFSRVKGRVSPIHTGLGSAAETEVCGCTPLHVVSKRSHPFRLSLVAMAFHTIPTRGEPLPVHVSEVSFATDESSVGSAGVGTGGGGDRR